MAAKAVTGRTTAMALAISRASRECDVCACKGARWYCGADAAYLCDHCDTQVHNANALAQRHERVRLTPAGIPMKRKSSESAPARKPSESAMAKSGKPAAGAATKKSKPTTHSPPLQVLPARKRTRSSRPHPHRRADPEPELVDVKVEETNLFSDFFDTEDFLIDHPQEVPSLIIAESPLTSPSSSEFNLEHSGPGSSSSSGLLSPGSSTDCFSPESFHGVSSSDSFAAFFKGKAAHQALELEDDLMSVEHFGLVPDSAAAGIDIICCDADGNISLAGDACFVPGDIPGLEAFDDCSLGFDLALRGASVALPEANPGILASKNSLSTGKKNAESDQYADGPFAKYFVRKSKKKISSSSSLLRLSPEIIKNEAKEILRCCTDDQQRAVVPTLRLNYEEIIAAWSGRGEPWVMTHPAAAAAACNNNNNSNNKKKNTATDVGLVPDMGTLPEQGGGERGDAHEDQDVDHGVGREARVSRYKEKRRSRLFSKTIRYEVRKLNAEGRPRMKGRFVKRTSSAIS